MKSDFQPHLFPDSGRKPGKSKRHAFPSWSIALSVLLALAVCGFGAHMALSDGREDGHAFIARLVDWVDALRPASIRARQNTDGASATGAVSGTAAGAAFGTVSGTIAPLGSGVADHSSINVASATSGAVNAPIAGQAAAPVPAAPDSTAPLKEDVSGHAVNQGLGKPLPEDEEEAVSSDPMALSEEDATKEHEPENDPALLSMDAAPEPDLADDTVFSPFAPEAAAMADPEALMNMPLDGVGHELPPEMDAEGILAGKRDSLEVPEPLCINPTAVDYIGVSGPYLLAGAVFRHLTDTGSYLYSLYADDDEPEIDLAGLEDGLPEEAEAAAGDAAQAVAEGARKVPAGLDPVWKPLLDALEKDGFDRKDTEAAFAKLGAKSYTPAFMAAKVAEIYGVPGMGINRENVPAPKLPKSYKIPVKAVTAGACVDFMKKQKKVLADIEKRHGVKPSTILSVLLVETRMGTSLGRDNALRVLGSMAMTATPEMLGSLGNAEQRERVKAGNLPGTLREKSRWAYKELKALLTYAQQQSYEPHLIPSSVFGAIGICQFMPSNVTAYGADGNKDGQVNLFDVTDAMYSVARYLEANGWRGAQGQPQKHAVIRTYNHSYSYASTVLATANYLDRALEGKVPLGGSPVIGVASHAPVRGRVLMRFGRGQFVDPALRNRYLRPVPKSARIRLDSYRTLLQ